LFVDLSHDLMALQFQSQLQEDWGGGSKTVHLLLFLNQMSSRELTSDLETSLLPNLSATTGKL
jgi:hypothetical protein